MLLPLSIPIDRSRRWSILTVCLLMFSFAMGQDFLNLAVDVQLEPASGINTKHLEYAPMYYDQGIVFVSAKDQDRWIDRRLGMPFFELMYAELGPDGMPGKPSSFSPNIRTRFHEGPAVFSTDLQQIYFTRSNSKNGQDVVGANDKINLKIYTADKGPEDWVNIKELPFCSDDYSVQSPALSPDNHTLIFMSDMPGGYGGWDLYSSTLSDGVWSAPVNLGPTVNTAKDERLPFWHRKGVLFFSSDGHQGLGGLDIFASLREEDGAWSAPVNLGPKFNSRKDDLSFICDPEGKTGFFASSRKESLGKDDIYRFVASESIFSNWLKETPVYVEMSVTVRNSTTMNPVKDISAWVFPMGPDGPEGLTQYFDHTDTSVSRASDMSQYRLHEGIHPIDAGHLSDQSGMIPLKLDPQKDYYVILQGDDYQQREVLLPHASIVQGSNYYLDISPASAHGLVNGEDCLVSGAIVLSGSSDKPLSGALVQVRNNCTANVQVIETNDQGRFKTCLVPDCDYQIRITKPGYLEHAYLFDPGKDPADRTVTLLEEDLEARKGSAPEAGDVLVLDHIYYDFNKSAIRTGDTRELNSLADMMLKYPSMIIELESHTDSRGTADYNMELSKRRGESVKDFLVSRGVAGQRIILKPMGESRLRNHCADGVPCTEAEHQENRRTEIHILKVDPDLDVRYPEGR